jgi:hypothetical protein
LIYAIPTRPIPGEVPYFFAVFVAVAAVMFLIVIGWLLRRRR